MTRPIKAIWAEDLNGTIGFDNAIPWHSSLDFKHFKETTKNSYLVMGRKTFESIGAKSLPSRKTIVITTDKTYKSEDTNTTIVHSIDAALNLINSINPNISVFICGGKSIYEQFMPYTTEIIQTVIQHAYLGDTTIPKIDKSIWAKLKSTKVTKVKEPKEPQIIINIYKPKLQLHQ